MELTTQPGGREDPHHTAGAWSTGSFWCEVVGQFWDIHCGELGGDISRKGGAAGLCRVWVENKIIERLWNWVAFAESH